MSFVNTKDKKLVVGEEYQYQSDRLSDFTRKNIEIVVLLKDNSDEKYYKLKLMNVDTKEQFDIEMLKGNFYYAGMPRLWDKDEYSI